MEKRNEYLVKNILVKILFTQIEPCVYVCSLSMRRTVPERKVTFIRIHLSDLLNRETYHRHLESTEEVVWTSFRVATAVWHDTSLRNTTKPIILVSPVAERLKFSLIQICSATESRHEAQRREPVRYIRHIRYRVKILI